MVDELAEKDRLNGGQADIAGVGDVEGDEGGEQEALLSGGVLKATVGTGIAWLT